MSIQARISPESAGISAIHIVRFICGLACGLRRTTMIAQIAAAVSSSASGATRNGFVERNGERLGYRNEL